MLALALSISIRWRSQEQKREKLDNTWHEIEIQHGVWLRLSLTLCDSFSVLFHYGHYLRWNEASTRANTREKLMLASHRFTH